MAKMNKKSMHMVFLLIIIVIASSLVFVYPSRQGMSNMDNAASLDWNMGQGMSGKSWTSKADDYASSMGYTDSIKAYGQYQGTPIPLPEGQLDFFANNQFKPECCVSSTYSTGSGCACMSTAQVNYINQRGGNRTIAPEEF